MAIKHFLDIAKHDKKTLRQLLDDSLEFKKARQKDILQNSLGGKILAMLFEQPSTRTRTSFDVAMRKLGGTTLFVEREKSHLHRGETIADTARVLSRYVDIIVMRTNSHDSLIEMAKYASVPVINALTDFSHPCQILADIMTFEEHRGSIAGKTLAWSGDGNNVLNSLIEASVVFNFCLKIATPKSRRPKQELLTWAKDKNAKIEIFENIEQAAANADCVLTDKWFSMGMDENEGGNNIFVPFQVNEKIMKMANKDAIFMHCLPAKRGEEVMAEVIDGKQSVVFDEAENRLYTQMAILHWCLKGA